MMSSILLAQVKTSNYNTINSGDTLVLDSLTLIPGTITFYQNDTNINVSHTWVNGTGSIVLNESVQNVAIHFATLPVNLGEEKFHKDTTLIYDKDVLTNAIPYSLQSAEKRQPVFFEGLNKSGSLSRGVTVGNNQDAVLNSNLNLQLSGKINDNTTISASITDNQIPVYAEGISQTLREFDRVFIEIKNDKIGKIRAGDYDIGPSGNYFLRFKKRISGAGLRTPIKTGNGLLTIEANGALARGEFNRNTLRGQEGNQGPYKLVGKNNELTILVISGSERVYIDGRLMTRGLENDYFINYTTGEITFTSLHPITKDSRIVVEFQYTVQNYVRSIIYGGADYQSNMWNHGFYVYSEQDAKNQPIRPLNEGDQRTLFFAGNDITKAVSPSWQETPYDANKILYKIVDTLNTDTVFVYSTNPADTLYEVFFSYVGENRGDYLPVQSAANGQVYQYIEPDNGIPQGTHIPYAIIPRPQKIQVLSYRGGFKSKKKDHLQWEFAYSNNDPNTFSNLDYEEQTGIAAKAGYKKDWTKKKWTFSAIADAELTSENFQTVERIRNVEFTRDWNIQQVNKAQTILSTAQFRAQQQDQFIFHYKGEYLNLTNFFNGVKNNGLIKVRNNGWLINASFSHLVSNDTLRKTTFYRQKSRIEKHFKSLFFLGLKSEIENNSSNPEFQNPIGKSYRFYDYRTYVGYGDTAKTYVKGGYFNRTDDTVRVETWQRAANASGYFIQSRFNDKDWGSLLFQLQYRELEIITDDEKDEINSVTTRMQYNNRFFKGFIGWNTFYETGMGSEPLRNYKYLKVPKGTGTHIWIDYNENGIEEVDEFERAPFPDQADYIRIFVITRQNVPVSSLKFSQQIDLNFDRLGLSKNNFLRKWSWQNYALLENKELLTGSTNKVNPFDRDISDSLLIQSVENFRSTLFFNRVNPVYGADYTYQTNTAKNLLSYGIENVQLLEHTLNFRYLFNKKLDCRLRYKNENKTNRVPDFETRNYQISGNSLQPIIAYQSGPYFRVSADYTYTESANIDDANEELEAQKFGGELQYNNPKIITISTRFEFVKNSFVGNEFSPAGFEMLKGLKNGNNALWRLTMQKNLTTFLQISLNYDGRVSEDSPIIHTGSMQVKAFF